VDLPPTTIALLSLAALCAGTVDAIAGGGGLIAMPALLAAGLPERLALGTNKGQSVWGTLVASIGYARAGFVDARRAIVGFLLALAGAAGGSGLVLLLRPEVLRPIVLALLVSVAALLALRPRTFERAAPPPGRARVIAAIGALGIGFYDGFFGPGAGTFLILLNAGGLGDRMAHASGNAKVVNLGSNVAALCMFAWSGTVLWRIALPMAAAQMVGGFLGARIAVRPGGDRVVRVVVLLVVIGLVVKIGRSLTSG
jgi:uncharacterized membrane protein YfcA